MVNKFDGIKPGDIVFVTSSRSWKLNDPAEKEQGIFIVTRVNGSSFYAHQENTPVNAEYRFNRKTSVAIPYPGVQWTAHLSKQHFDKDRYDKQQHTHMLDKVRTQAKNLTTEELEQVHAFMKSLIPKRVLK